MKNSHIDVKDIILNAEGLKRVIVNGDLPLAISNPVQCSKTSDRIFWGDIHVHSKYHDYNSKEKHGLWMVHPDVCYKYAKEVSFLDFAAVTDSCFKHSAEGWEENQKSANKHYQPGKFVTFRGFEAGFEEGHRHVLFSTGGLEPPYPNDMSYTFPQIHEYFCDRSDVLMIPHHVKGFIDWNTHDPKLEPVVEVYSSWGSSERPGVDMWEKQSRPGGTYQDALRRGYRLGVTASADLIPYPGRCSPGTIHCFTPYRGGLVAVFAKELTRESIFQAIRSRSCYATTGARIILRIEVNSVPMGQELRLSTPKQPRKIRVSVIGTNRLICVEVIKNCEVWNVPQVVDESLEWEGEDNTVSSGEDVYYVRVKQADGHHAWSSPVWVVNNK